MLLWSIWREALVLRHNELMLPESSSLRIILCQDMSAAYMFIYLLSGLLSQLSL